MYQKKFTIYGRLNDIFAYCRALESATINTTRSAIHVDIDGFLETKKVNNYANYLTLLIFIFILL